MLPYEPPWQWQEQCCATPSGSCALERATVNTAVQTRTWTQNSCCSRAGDHSTSVDWCRVAQCTDLCWAKCSSCCCSGCLVQSDGAAERRCRHVACSHQQKRFGRTRLARTIKKRIMRKEHVSLITSRKVEDVANCAPHRILRNYRRSRNAYHYLLGSPCRNGHRAFAATIT